MLQCSEVSVANESIDGASNEHDEVLLQAGVNDEDVDGVDGQVDTTCQCLQ